MAITNFIPEVWSARLTRILQPNLVIGQFVNHDWEGEIKEAGDTVHIRGFNTAGTIRTYARNTAMAAPDVASDSELTLVIDQAKAFYIQVDDIDSVQSDITIMDKFLERTGRKMAEFLDRYAVSKYVAGLSAGMTLGSAGVPITLGVTGTPAFTPYKFCVEARRRLAKNSVPLTDLWMVVNADVEALFLNDPAFISGGSGIGDATVVRNGTIGQIAGFTVYRTEAVALPGDLNQDGDAIDAGETVTATGSDGLGILFGAGDYAQTWADQVVKVEAERLQGQFSDAVKGLHVFGSKIVENTSYGLAYVDPS